MPAACQPLWSKWCLTWSPLDFFTANQLTDNGDVTDRKNGLELTTNSFVNPFK